LSFLQRCGVGRVLAEQVFGGTGELVERGISLIVVDRASALVMQLMGLAGRSQNRT
jgi:hypothetical protein